MKGFMEEKDIHSIFPWFLSIRSKINILQQIIVINYANQNGR